MITIQSLKDISIDKLYEAWEDAFSDYAVSIGREELQRMLQRRGYSAELSFGAFDDRQLVSFTLNGIGTHNHRNTVYDTGTGTVKAYRGKGLVKQVFVESLPYLKQAGMQQYLLEVLQDNAPAISIYKGLGFKENRQFAYFVQPADELSITAHPLPDGYHLKTIENIEPDKMTAMWDVQPAWQNSFQSVNNRRSGFVILGVYKGSQLVGYGIAEPISGDITQLAVHHDHRRRGIASAIFRELVAENKSNIIKLINVEHTCSSVISFLAHHGIQQSGMQYEMLMDIE